jgi:hypothetical protein
MKMTQYLKWKSDPSKGEVFTPVGLVKEILDKIPEEVWKNPDSVFLDPCMGKGTFLIEIVRRLTYIYGYTEIDAKSRVYGYDIRVKYINHLQRRGFINARHKDFLSEIIKMKFDVIVGNPPYQKSDSESDAGKLYIDISKKSLSLLKDGGIISFLTPDTILRDGRNKFSLKGYEGLKEVDYTANLYFKVGVNIVSWIIDKNYNGSIKITNEDTTTEIREPNTSLVQTKDLLLISLFERLKQNREKLFISDQQVNDNSETPTEDYQYPVYMNFYKNKISYSKEIPKLYQKRKIFISISKTYETSNFGISYDDFGQLHLMIDVTDLNETQILNIKNFLFNHICVAICNKYKKLYKTGFNNMLYVFPKIDFDKSYTDNEVKELFGLNDIEIESILS